MRPLALAFLLTLLPGCNALSAMGVGANDILPTLKHCDDVQYVRTKTDLKITATCKVPAG